MTDHDRSVVFVSQHFPPDKGGNAARIHDVASNLSRQSWDVSVLAPPPCYPPSEFDRSWQRSRTETVDGVTVHRLWSWQPRAEDPGRTARLAYYLLFGIHAMVWLLLNAGRYEAVITTTPPISTGAPGLVAAAAGKPWIVDVRDLWIDASISLGYLEAGSLLERVSRRFQRRVLRSADRIAVTTAALGESLADEYGDSLAEKTILVPNGVDTDRFHPADDTAGDAERPTDGQRPAPAGAQTDGGRPKIVYTGNLGAAQDLESCVRAMGHLPHDAAVLRLIGRGDVESDLRRLTEELGLSDRVEFTGAVPREEVPGLLRAATVGIAPLKDTADLAYAMPTKVYEYMACGLPTLVTGRGEVERFVAESGGGVHVENDPERIAARLEELLEDDELRSRLGENGREYVRANYDRTAIARRLGTELDRLIGGECA